MKNQPFEMILIKFIIAILLGVVIAYVCEGDQRTQIVIPRECLTEVKLGDGTTCSGPDMKSLTCYRIIVTYKKGCEHLEILQEGK